MRRDGPLPSFGHPSGDKPASPSLLPASPCAFDGGEPGDATRNDCDVLAAGYKTHGIIIVSAATAVHIYV